MTTDASNDLSIEGESDDWAASDAQPRDAQPRDAQPRDADDEPSSESVAAPRGVGDYDNLETFDDESEGERGERGARGATARRVVYELPAGDDAALELADFLGHPVVLDTRGPILYIGELRQIGRAFLTLAPADVHDLSEGATTKERYLVETAKHGLRKNRDEVLVRRQEVVSLSRLRHVTRY